MNAKLVLYEVDGNRETGLALLPSEDWVLKDKDCLLVIVFFLVFKVRIYLIICSGLDP